MSTTVFLMILGAALVHASWNALVKADGDRIALLKTMFLTQFACSICLIPFVPFPARGSWPYLCAGAVLGTGYMLFLNWAYRVGDLSHVYPFARGTAPLIVAIIAVAFLGEQMGHMGEVAVVLIAVGIASLAMTRGAAGFREPRPVLLSLIASGFVAGYTKPMVSVPDPQEVRMPIWPGPPFYTLSWSPVAFRCFTRAGNLVLSSGPGETGSFPA